MTIEYLEEFRTVVRHRNITRAAEALFKSQSTLSRHLSELEGELGAQLIERDNRVFRLTAAGEYFYQETQGILSDLDRVRRKVRQLGDGYTGSLHILSFCSYVPYIFDEVLSFRREHPEILCSVDYRHRVIPSLLEEEDADALVLRAKEEGSDIIYDVVDDEEELRIISKYFEELLEDVELRME